VDSIADDRRGEWGELNDVFVKILEFREERKRR